MKRLTFLATALAVMMFMAPPAHAQKYYAGVIGGLNNAAFTLDDHGVDREVSTRQLLAVGGVFGLSLNKTFSIQLEPMVLQKGGIVSDNTPHLYLKSTYLELPVFLKVGKVSLNKKEQAYLMAGPTVGLLLSSEMTGEVNGLTFKGDTKDIQRNIDFGLALGGGIGFSLGRGSLFVEARYTFGLTDNNKGGMVDFKSGDIVISDDIRAEDRLVNKGFQLLVGYTLPLGKKKSI
jgi:opacity protein-like surface antigen